MRHLLLRDFFFTWLSVIRRPDVFFSALPGDAAPPWPFAITVYTCSMASCVLLHLWSLGHARANSGTVEEQMACTPDVFRLCSAQIPSEERIVACLGAQLWFE